MTNGAGPRLRRATAYAVGDFGLNLYWNGAALFLVYWYVEVAGLSARTAGLLYAIGLVGDFLFDPVVASGAERVRSSFGTYRPFLLFVSPLLAGSFVLLLTAPPVTGSLAFVWLLAALLLFRTLYTLVAVPYSALAARLTYVSEERTEIAGVRMFFALTGLLVVASLFKPAATLLGSGDLAVGFRAVAAAAAAIATTALIACGILSRELPALGARTAQNPGLASFVAALRRNNALRTFLVAVVFQSAGAALTLILLPFYLESQEPGRGGGTLLGYALGNVLAVPVWTIVVRSIGKRRSWITASAITAASAVLLLVGSAWNVAGIPVAVLGIGAGFSAFAILVWAMAPDIVDYGQAQMGQRTEGAVFALLLMTQKLGGSLSALAAGMLVAWSGYDAGEPIQAKTVVSRLGLAFALLPACLVVLSSLAISRFPFDRTVHRSIVEGLRRDEARATKPEEADHAEHA